MKYDERCLDGEYRGSRLAKGLIKDLPYNCIGLVQVQSRTIGGAGGFGTGFLIASSIVLTSAHTLFVDIDRKAHEMRPFHFCLSVYGDIKSSNEQIPITNWYVPPEFKEIFA